MAFRLPGRSNPSTIRPLEIGRRLLRAIDDNVDIDIKGRRVSPDTFTVSLSETDRAALAEDEKASSKNSPQRPPRTFEMRGSTYSQQ